MSEMIIITKPPHNRSSIPFPKGENKTIQTMGDYDMQNDTMVLVALKLSAWSGTKKDKGKSVLPATEVVAGRTMSRPDSSSPTTPVLSILIPRPGICSS